MSPLRSRMRTRHSWNAGIFEFLALTTGWKAIVSRFSAKAEDTERTIAVDGLLSFPATIAMLGSACLVRRLRRRMK